MLSLMSSFRLTWWINSVFLELLLREDVLCFIFGFKLSVEPDETFTFQTLSAEKVRLAVFKRMSDILLKH